MFCIKNGDWQVIPGEHDNAEVVATTTASHIHATSRKSAMTVQQLQYYTCPLTARTCIHAMM
jgi:hypothetical protein